MFGKSALVRRADLTCYGENHYNFNCTKIFYTHERRKPSFGLYDYGFTLEYTAGDIGFATQRQFGPEFNCAEQGSIPG